MIYLDNGATTFQKPPQVQAAMIYAMENCASAGRGGYAQAMAAAEVLYETRQKAANLFDADLEQVVFTTSATHSLNIAIRTLIEPGDRVVVSGFEHNAVMRPLYHLGAGIKVAATKLFDQEDTLKGFEEAVDENTKAVVCTHVSNVFGYILPIQSIADLCQKRGVPLIIDCAQSAGILPVSLKETKAAFLAMPGHKGLYGPQGTGLLICGHPPKPLLFGGTGSLSKSYKMPDFLPDSLEPGTHNISAIAGLGEGLDFVKQETVEKLFEKETKLRKNLEKMFKNQENIKLFTGEYQAPVLSCQVEGLDCETVAYELGKAEIAVRSGLHCAPLAHQSGGTLSRGTIRFSFGAFNKSEEIWQVARAMRNLSMGI